MTAEHAATDGKTGGVVAIAKTARRRFLWCAWWTRPPERDPFRAPDAWSGGAESEDEALRQAERAAGCALRVTESAWAGAFLRTRKGLPPWFVRRQSATPSTRGASAADAEPYAVLGVAPNASATDLKRAFRARALASHPDRGGDVEAFLRVKQAYDTIVTRRAARDASKEKRARRPKRKRT